LPRSIPMQSPETALSAMQFGGGCFSASRPFLPFEIWDESLDSYRACSNRYASK
jgi:hypothetical protein